MGNVSSRYDEASMLYLRDQNRLTISSLLITNSRRKTVLHVVPNTFPATKVCGSREVADAKLVEYVQDPETTSNYPNYILKLNNDDEITFKFSFIIRQIPSSDLTTQLDTTINGLTYISASTAREIETLVTREFHADPNLHKNANVQLVGDYSTNGHQSVTFDWSWKWRPPKAVEDRGGGWRNTCSFVEYDQRAHRLNTLASFSFWVSSKKPVQSLYQEIPNPITDQQYSSSQPNSPCGHLGLSPSINSRVPSSQYLGSRRVSEVETRNTDDPPSPNFANTEDSLVVEHTSLKDSIKVDVCCQRPSKDINETEDGPLFRATMKALEQKTGNMRQRMKKVLKKAEAAYLAQTESNEAISAFMEALHEASSSNANAVQPALEHYFDKIAREILAFERQSTINLQRIIIDPILKVYNIDIKQAESKKRDFEEESKDYYAYVSRYLGQRQDSLKEKKRADSDSKYQIKRRNFELKRFDYSSFMQDLHGGRKEQEVLSHLTKYADAQTRGYLATAKRIEEMLPQLDALTVKVHEADKEFQYQRTEREEKRRNLEKSNPSYTEPDILLSVGSIPVPVLVGSSPTLNTLTESDTSRSENITSQLKPSQPSSLNLSNTLSNNGNYESPRFQGIQSSYLSPTVSSLGIQTKFKGIRDLEEKDRNFVNERNGAQRKEGLLWALSRPGSHSDPRGLNKQAWHKFWTVVDAGKVSEYSNWKQKLDLHREPIDLRMASVREARNAERRFCFEVITPQYKRVYQATSEEDMNSWILAINNAIQSAVEGRDIRDIPSPRSRQESHSKRRDIGSILTGKSSSINHGTQYNLNGAAQTTNGSVFRRTTVGARPAYSRKSSNGFDESPDKLLQLLRDTDQGNCWCADCNSGIKTEWVSINLGIILCIECSGIHRSLGTHISKIRSLTLDLQSFTTDIVELLMLVGNRLSNMIWEAKMDPGSKPSPQATREIRLRFITSKYVDRKYVQPISSKLSRYSTADETLLAGIKRNEIQQVIYALALRANPNVCDRSRGTHCVFLALATADPASPSSTVTIAMIKPKSDKTVAFPIAEILIQNGADIPTTLPAFPLSQNACLYIEQKNGRGLTSVDTVGSLPNSNNSSKERHHKERETRLQKRVSAGGRLAKAPIPEV